MQNLDYFLLEVISGKFIGPCLNLFFHSFVYLHTYGVSESDAHSTTVLLMDLLAMRSTMLLYFEMTVSLISRRKFGVTS